MIVADSKLYSAETIGVLSKSKLNWICRVPASLDAVNSLEQDVRAQDLSALGDSGYSSACYTYTYGGVDQHWEVYHSLSAAEREENTLKKQLDKEQAKAQTSLRKLSRQRFHCKEDALDAAAP